MLDTMRLVLLICCVLSSAAFAKPAAKPIPVAAGYPDWQGVEEKNYVRGRHICAADLRQTVTAVVVIDAAKAAEQLELSKGVGRAFGSFCGTEWDGPKAWEKDNIRHDYIALYTFAGASGKKSVLDAFSKGTALKEFPGSVSIYADVTCAGLPAPTELPFLYVFGPDGKEPLFAKKVDTTSLKEFVKLLRPNMSKLPKWKRFYGIGSEENGFPQLKKAVDAGKPLAPILVQLQKAAQSSDATKAKEAQILADALEQTRSALVYQISAESSTIPYCAQSDLNLLLRHWPEEKSNPLLAKAFKILSGKDASALSAIYLKTQDWGAEGFAPKNAGEAKKIVQELQKMKKKLEVLKESPDLKTQSGACTLEQRVDNLIAVIPTKVK